MVERVTFFGEKGPEQKQQSQRLEVEGPDGLRVLLAWTAKPSNPFSNLPDSNVDVRGLTDELVARIREQGGGILVEVHPGTGTVRIHRGVTNGRDGIHQTIRLSPFGGTGEHALTGDVEELQLERGEHLLVPVSVRAEERLLQLRDLLGEMGPDMEALVLNTLRSPSLDARLGRLEEALELDRSGAPTTSGRTRRKRKRSKVLAEPDRTGGRRAARSRRRPGLLGVILAVLVVGLVLVATWLFLKHRGEMGGAATTPAPAAATTTEPATPGGEAGIDRRKGNPADTTARPGAPEDEEREALPERSQPGRQPQRSSRRPGTAGARP